MPDLSNVFGRVAVAYLAVAVYLYAHILGTPGNPPTLLFFYVVALFFSLVIFPLTAAGFVTYNIWKVTKDATTPVTSLAVSLPGILIAALPLAALAAGAPSLNRLLWLILYVGPLGPLLSLFVASIALSRKAELGLRLWPLVLLCAFVPSAVMWITVLVSSSPLPDSELKDGISVLIGGAGARLTGLREVAPYFVVYLSSGAALLAAYLGSKMWIRHEP